MSECISCIKDGVTGICRDIKDKIARANIEELTTKLNEVINLVNSLSGVDGGHLATDEDLAGLQASITTLQNTVNELDNTYAKDSDITTLQTSISDLQTQIEGLSANAGGSSGVTLKVIEENAKSLGELPNIVNKLNELKASGKILKLTITNSNGEISKNINTVTIKTTGASFSSESKVIFANGTIEFRLIAYNTFRSSDAFGNGFITLSLNQNETLINYDRQYNGVDYTDNSKYFKSENLSYAYLDSFSNYRSLIFKLYYFE